MKKPIPFDRALRTILRQKVEPTTCRVATAACYGRVAAENIRSSVDNPPFRQSAMDGYAMRYNPGQLDYSLSDHSCDIPAGKLHDVFLSRGQAIRIFTGARLPQKADTVVAQEQVDLDGGMIHVRDKDFRKGRNVRLQGSHFRTGQLLLPKGVRINSGAVALISQAGRSRVVVYRRPRVGILVTGDELVSSGKPLKGAEIFESNSATLSALLAARGILEVRTGMVSDDPALIRKQLSGLMRWADLILVTGGVSVGDYDHVPGCIESLGVEILFHKVLQKPGKPVLFGRRGKRFVFGLPGNPGSVISCFHTLVAPLLNKLEGERPVAHVLGYMKQEVRVKKGLVHFLKARLVANVVEVLEGQESYKVDAYVNANVLVMLPGDRDHILSGEEVICIPIRH